MITINEEAMSCIENLDMVACRLEEEDNPLDAAHVTNAILLLTSFMTRINADLAAQADKALLEIDSDNVVYLDNKQLLRSNIKSFLEDLVSNLPLGE